MAHLRAAPRDEAGFSLVEMLVAVGLFALIGAAGFALVDGVLRAEDRTDGRLQRLGELQRGMHLITLDFEQADPGMLGIAGEGVVIRQGEATVRYVLTETGLERAVTEPFRASFDQLVVSGASAASWSFHFEDVGWQDDWTPEDEARPDAIALSLTLDDSSPGPRGVLRRVIALAAEPPQDALAGLGR